jgi:hypothetical protein
MTIEVPTALTPGLHEAAARVEDRRVAYATKSLVSFSQRTYSICSFVLQTLGKNGRLDMRERDASDQNQRRVNL